MPRAEPGPSAPTPLTHPTCGDGLLSWQGCGWTAPCGLGGRGAPPTPALSCCPAEDRHSVWGGGGGCLLSLGSRSWCVSRAGYGGAPTLRKQAPSAPPPRSPQPFIPAFHLSPGDGALVAVTTPQRVPARCHGTQRCFEPNPRTPAAPPQGPVPFSAPPPAPQGCLVPSMGPSLRTPRGLAGPGGWEVPLPQVPTALSSALQLRHGHRGGKALQAALPWPLPPQPPGRPQSHGPGVPLCQGGG